jgi:di/tricarboxylate transporter
MTFDQVAILALMATLLAGFALQRLRVELVALVGLAAGFLLGLVPARALFSGFANPAVVTVVEMLLIVQVLARTRAIDVIAGHVIAHVREERLAVAVLCGAAAAVSVFINNVGALALMLPIAIAVCAGLGMPMARVLMPMSFATLLGGLCSVIGTPANLLVSQTLETATGTALGFFDLATVGLPLTLAGIVWLVWQAPRIAAGAPPVPVPPPGLGARKLIAEVVLTARSELCGLTPGMADSRLEGRVHAIFRDGRRLFGRREHFRLQPADVLLVETPAETLEALRASGALEWPAGPGEGSEEPALVDAVVLPESVVVGSRIGAIAAFADRRVQVVAIASRSARRIEGRFEDLALGIGDVMVLRGAKPAVEEALAEVDALALSPRQVPSARPGAFAVGMVAVGILVAATGLLAPETAFGLVVLALALSGALRLREGLETINWPIVIMLAAMIPLGAAVSETGAAAVLAEALVALAPEGTPLFPVGCLLVASVALTPFVNNPSIAVALAPIAVAVAESTGLPPAPLLVAVAVGASIDFLTPFGHHNNTLVMGLAGYRFSDFPRLGAPLTLISIVVALVALQLFWL